MANSSSTYVPLLERADDYARREPARAFGTAFGIGLLLHVLPVGTIASMFISLVFALARPVLLLLGVYKAVDLIRATRPDHIAKRDKSSAA